MKSDITARSRGMPIPTPDGEFIAHYSKLGLCALEFPSGAKSKSGAAQEKTSAATHADDDGDLPF